MFCKNCGTPIPPGQQRCPNCGQSVEQEANQGPYYQGGFQQHPDYQSGYYQSTPPIKYRSIGLCILFSVITCGIYSLYWMVQLTEDANALSGDDRTSGGMALLFTIITCGIYGIYWAYKQGEKIDYMKQSRGIPSSNSGVLYLFLEMMQLGIIGSALMQNEINKFATIQ